MSKRYIEIASGYRNRNNCGGDYISMGTRFQGAITDGLPGNQLNSPNNAVSKQQFWTSTAIRNKNISFCGGLFTIRPKSAPHRTLSL